MSYRRRMEILLERRRQRAMDNHADRDIYYSHRLRVCEDILSRVFSRKVSLTYKGGWVRFNGKNYRVEAIEAHAMYLDALTKEREDDQALLSGSAC